MENEGNIQIIGQGTYGCVYRPNIQCRTQNIGSKQYLSKLQRKDKTSTNEIKLGKIIREKLHIRGDDDRFAPILESCPVNIGKLEEDKLSSCKMVVQGKDKIKKTGLVSNKLFYVGKQTLGDFLESKLLKSKKNKTYYFKKVVNSQLYLLKSLEILNKINIVHMDLKHNNIMYHEKRKKPVIIDFGLSFHGNLFDINKYISEGNTPFGIAVPFYIPWPIETILLSHLAKDLSTNEKHVQEEKLTTQFNEITKYEEIGKTYIKKHGLLQSDKICSAKEREIFSKKTLSWIQSWKGKTWRDLWIQLSSSHKTWDNYSVCVMYLIEMQMSGLQEVTNDNTNHFVKKYVEVLKTVMLSSYNERDLPEVTRKKLTTLFQNIPKTEYEQTMKEHMKIVEKNHKKIEEHRNKEELKTLQEEKRVHQLAEK